MPTPNVQPLAVGTVGYTITTSTVSAANTNRDGTTGTYVTFLTAGSAGALVPRITATHMGASGVASTAMVLRLWRVVGATTILESEVALPSATPNTTTIGATVSFPKTNIMLKAGEVLKLTQTVAETVGYIADQGGDY